jgi:hypothetical protein
MICPYYFLYSLFNKIRDKGRTVSVWKRGVRKGEGGGGGRGRDGVWGKGKKLPKPCMHV